MSIETLEQAIEEAQAELDGRGTRRMIAWAIVTIVLFFVPIVLFFQYFAGTTYETSYAPIVIIWLMVAMGSVIWLPPRWWLPERLSSDLHWLLHHPCCRCVKIVRR